MKSLNRSKGSTIITRCTLCGGRKQRNVFPDGVIFSSSRRTHNKLPPSLCKHHPVGAKKNTCLHGESKGAALLSNQINEAWAILSAWLVDPRRKGAGSQCRCLFFQLPTSKICPERVLMKHSIKGSLTFHKWLFVPSKLDGKMSLCELYRIRVFFFLFLTLKLALWRCKLHPY